MYLLVGDRRDRRARRALGALDAFIVCTKSPASRVSRQKAVQISNCLQVLSQEEFTSIFSGGFNLTQGFHMRKKPLTEVVVHRAHDGRAIL